MPRFYFSVVDNSVLDDDEGTELPDLAAAQRHAIAVARELMTNRDSMLGEPWKDWTMTIKNDKGQEVFSTPIGELSTGER